MIRNKTEVFRARIDTDFFDPAHESNFWKVLSREFKREHQLLENGNIMQALLKVSGKD